MRDSEAKKAVQRRLCLQYRMEGYTVEDLMSLTEAPKKRVKRWLKEAGLSRLHSVMRIIISEECEQSRPDTTELTRKLVDMGFKAKYSFVHKVIEENLGKNTRFDERYELIKQRLGEGMTIEEVAESLGKETPAVAKFYRERVKKEQGNTSI